MSSRLLLSTLVFVVEVFFLFSPIVTLSSHAMRPTFFATLSDISAGEAESFIRSLSDQAARTLTRRDISSTERAGYFRELLIATADLEFISRFVLGRHWRKATEVEQTEFTRLFEDIAVYTWSRRFAEYSGRDLAIVGVRPGVEGVVVESVASQSQGLPLSVLWKLRRSEKGLRLTDLVVEGVSMAVTYRSEYSAVIQRSGGEVIGLLIALRTKISELRNSN